MLTLTAMLGLFAAADPVKAPVVGRPLDFSGAIGGPFKVTMTVDPTSIAVEEPFTISLQIAGPGNLKSIDRPALDKLEAFTPFAIENGGDSFNEELSQRTFLYRLRARRSNITHVPAVKFVYFNPAFVHFNRGYQTTATASIPIEVRSQAVKSVSPTDSLAKHISALRRALVTDPASEQLRAELEAARSEVPYPDADMRPANSRWPSWLSLIRLGAFAVSGFLLIGLALARQWFGRLPIGLLTATLGILAVSGIAVGFLIESPDRTQPVVVLKANTELRRGNGPDYPMRIEAPLPAGAEVRRLFERGDWLQVELANGVVGWVPRQSAFAE